MNGLAQWAPGPGGPNPVWFAAANPRRHRPLPIEGPRTHRGAT
ncbi:hypothetical protein FB390_6714 [Nocardia bhagyanarayanae]|uniref:Uncharacterized protein n=1 Tax=Nocardia bhagyanarayanae TaxID=1215925 RepID=A0A543EY75_9NOCA|nr:hypothetical protein FB390_6714 [Nocardia bhagyanarayanae]